MGAASLLRKSARYAACFHLLVGGACGGNTASTALPSDDRDAGARADTGGPGAGTNVDDGSSAAEAGNAAAIDATGVDAPAAKPIDGGTSSADSPSAAFADVKTAPTSLCRRKPRFTRARRPISMPRAVTAWRVWTTAPPRYAPAARSTPPFRRRPTLSRSATRRPKRERVRPTPRRTRASRKPWTGPRLSAIRQSTRATMARGCRPWVPCTAGSDPHGARRTTCGRKLPKCPNKFALAMLSPSLLPFRFSPSRAAAARYPASPRPRTPALA